jgi:hypothetical protein
VVEEGAHRFPRLACLAKQLRHDVPKDVQPGRHEACRCGSLRLMSDGPKPIPNTERVSVAGFAAANCEVWARASRRNLERVQALAPREQRIDRLGDLWLGLIALEQALTAARYLVANDAPATSDLPIADLDRRWWDVCEIRNAVVHMPGRIGTTGTFPDDLDLDGVRAGDHWLSFVEWTSLLDALEPWAAAHARLGRGLSGEDARRPPGRVKP